MPLRRLAPHLPSPRRLLRSLNPSTAMAPAAGAAHLATAADPDEDLCASAAESVAAAAEGVAPAPPLPPPPVSAEERIERAWAHWRRLGSPRLMVAPMVDNSELPFRMLCRRYGADAAYTPMLHSRIFSENEKYRSMEFTTCKEDRPLFVQFCANDPDILLQAAKMVEPYCDYVDINFGCPQRIARRGNYGAFLMDNLPLVKSLVQNLSANLHVPVSVKIRIFPRLEDTLAYAKMLEEAGASLVAVHGRTRDEKDGKKFRANWDAIKAVKDALRVPVLANGNIRHMEDVKDCLEHTGADGVLSAETLLENPALFAGFRTKEWKEDGDENGDSSLDQADLVIEYLKLCEQYPVPWRMVRSHVHKMLGDWFRVHPEVREELNKQNILTFEWLHDMVMRLKELGGRVPLYRKECALQTTANGLAVSNA
ncbi:tRNA-dihydrouridine(16/17) synthase [NAD(P)(+)]-like [Dichanthelium oligosanthes]|uniref:tRNA-dihydrouridine(16/17) synthase [NAD(P)(+)] n=1 Tax=Dichanthelium oligosanthes TaxID=888268 RepID=A0A1E5V2D8_9POAL|nr:tRNA-dihydrouridine(16/17) synthase [NAD(P)(+)]-like [Dichanthelium oligosanthes]